MNYIENRIASFDNDNFKQVLSPKGKLQIDQKKFAKAGFYLKAQANRKLTLVTDCVCKVSVPLNNTNKLEDPFLIHCKKGKPHCYDLVFKCLPRLKTSQTSKLPSKIRELVSPDKSYLSEIYDRLRTLSFKSFIGFDWDDSVQNKCTIKTLSKAGFYYSGTKESKDQTSCPSCDLSLDFWERHDDPLLEHIERAPKCSFLTKSCQMKRLPKYVGFEDGSMVIYEELRSESGLKETVGNKQLLEESQVKPKDKKSKRIEFHGPLLEKSNHGPKKSSPASNEKQKLENNTVSNTEMSSVKIEVKNEAAYQEIDENTANVLEEAKLGLPQDEENLKKNPEVVDTDACNALIEKPEESVINGPKNPEAKKDLNANEIAQEAIRSRKNDIFQLLQYIRKRKFTDQEKETLTVRDVLIESIESKAKKMRENFEFMLDQAKATL